MLDWLRPCKFVALYVVVGLLVCLPATSAPAQPSQAPPPPTSGSLSAGLPTAGSGALDTGGNVDMSAELARTFVSLILVLALIVGILLIVRKLGVGGRIGLPSDKSQDIQVQSVRPLPGGGALYLVRALDRIVLIGATPQGGLRLLTEWLEADVPARARETAGTTPPTPDLGRTSPESPSAQKGPGA